MRATESLATFASNLRFEEIPPERVTDITLHILDTIGCGIAGASNDLTSSMLDFAQSTFAAGPCPLLATGSTFGAVGAAFLNAAAMNALDFDDGLEVDGRGLGHPGASLVAAALSAVWERKVDGRSFVAAVAAAYEINARIIQSMQPSYDRFREVYGVCQHQSIGAAAAFGRLTGLNCDAMGNAFGLAGTLANVPSLRKYNWDKRPLVSFKDFNAPAAEAGVKAVLLHQAGAVGANEVLDGDHGLWRMLGSDRIEIGVLTEGLGQDWLCRNASFKAFPSCRWMHTALESFRTLRDEVGLRPHEVERIVIRSSTGMARDFMDFSPANMVDAQFSLPFAISIVAHGDRAAADWYCRASINDSSLLSFCQRVTVEVDPEFDAGMSSEKRRPGGQALVIARGRTFEGPRLCYPLGTIERPLSRDALLRKFQENTVSVLGRQSADYLQNAILNLPEIDDIANMLMCLRSSQTSES